MCSLQFLSLVATVLCSFLPLIHLIRWKIIFSRIFDVSTLVFSVRKFQQMNEIAFDQNFTICGSEFFFAFFWFFVSFCSCYCSVARAKINEYLFHQNNKYYLLFVFYFYFNLWLLLYLLFDFDKKNPWIRILIRIVMTIKSNINKFVQVH